MKKVFVILVLFIGVLSSCFAQKTNHEQIKLGDKPVHVLTSMQNKNLCLLVLNKVYFLVTMDDIQLIDKKDIVTIKMYLPGNDDYNSLISKLQVKNINIGCAFEIETVAGVKLHEKFKVKK